MVVLTEGEVDALSVSQIQANRWPVASIPNGAQGAAKAIERSLEWLERFERVVFLFDNDEPGQSAAQECAALLSPGKAFIGRVPEPHKDSNDCLKAGQYKEVVDAIWGARAWRPDAILSFDEVWQRVVNRPSVPSIPIPHAGLMEKLGGLREGEITLLLAATGAGKSTAAREWAAFIAREGHRVGYIGLEDGAERTALGLVSVMISHQLHLDEHPNYNAPEVREALDLLRQRVMIYDDHGILESGNLVSRMRFLAVGEKCPIIVLDHLSIVTSGGDLKDDERRTLDKLMTDLVSLVKSTRVHVVAIAHLSRQKGTPHEEGRAITLADIRGSHGLAQLSFNVVAFERDQQAEGGDADVSTVRVLKCRQTGRTGVAGYVRFDTKTGRQLECPNPGVSAAFDDTTADVVS
jgi:twinkle protein